MRDLRRKVSYFRPPPLVLCRKRGAASLRGEHDIVDQRDGALRYYPARYRRSAGARARAAVAQRVVYLVPDRRNHGQSALGDRCRERFVVERVEVLVASAAAAKHYRIYLCAVERAHGCRHLRRRAVALHLYGIDAYFDKRRTVADHANKVAYRRTVGAGHRRYRKDVFGQLRSVFKVTARGELVFQLDEPRVLRALAA